MSCSELENENLVMFFFENRKMEIFNCQPSKIYFNILSVILNNFAITIARKLELISKCNLLTCSNVGSPIVFLSKSVRNLNFWIFVHLNIYFYFPDTFSD